MSASDKELSLSEMRMLVSSVIHMDVAQIALCVVTIPKLKIAVQSVLGMPAVQNVLGMPTHQVRYFYGWW